MNSRILADHSLDDSAYPLHVYWVDVFVKSIQFNITPISIANNFKKFQETSDSAWIFTSATLAANSSFDHFKSLMGLENAKTKLLKSPFSRLQGTLIPESTRKPPIPFGYFVNPFGKCHPIFICHKFLHQIIFLLVFYV